MQRVLLEQAHAQECMQCLQLVLLQGYGYSSILLSYPNCSLLGEQLYAFSKLVEV